MFELKMSMQYKDFIEIILKPEIFQREIKRKNNNNNNNNKMKEKSIHKLNFLNEITFMEFRYSNQLYVPHDCDNHSTNSF